MDPNDAGLEAMQLQIAQSLIEHHIVVQALYGVCAVSFVAVLLMGWFAFSSRRQVTELFEALVEQERTNSKERISQVKQHSLERASEQNQMLHAFEGIVSAKRRASASNSGG